MSTKLWHPNAKRLVIPGVPNLTMAGGGHKLVWHTTEGSSAEGAIGAYRQSTAVPHFTIGLKDGKRVLYQHLPLNRAATALRHPSGPETNRANAIQVEIVGFAARSGEWPLKLYHYLHLLGKFVETNANVPLRTTLPVTWRDPKRLSGSQFYNYSGHLGHMHAPGNDHVDPGVHFHIGHVTKDPL